MLLSTCPKCGEPWQMQKCGECTGNVEYKWCPCTQPIMVPEPPDLNLSTALSGGKKRDRCVITSASDPEGKALLSLSRGWMTKYAERLGADFLVLSWIGVPSWGQSSKFQLSRALDHYERVIFFDANTLANPEKCPDLFSLVPQPQLGIYDDLPGLRRGGKDQNLLAEYKAITASQGFPNHHVPWYGNTGVMVLNYSHKFLLRVPEKPIQPVHDAAQHLWVCRMLEIDKNYQRGVEARPIFFLPEEANFQWWEHSFFNPPENAILHFSGIRPMWPIEERLILMRRHIQK